MKQRMQQRPLLDALLKFQKQNPVSFHVPGHKHGLLSGLPEEMKRALKYDLTELAGLDDLHYPEEAIHEAQTLLAAAYKADQSFFLVNGSTAGNLAMILASCSENDTVLVQRNSHKSIFHGLELAKVRAVYVSPEWDDRSMTATHVSLKTIQEALSEYPETKAIILTYPNYYGMAGKHMREIIHLCHKRGICVLVDEAHGAHFMIGSPFPQSALALGADAVVQSAHKTLPAMTMGSFLHIRSSLLNTEHVAKYLRMVQSSSPSYLIMASLDDARAFAQSYTRLDLRYFLEKRQQFLSSLKAIDTLTVVETDDPIKLLLRTSKTNGYQLKKALERNGIHVELADSYQVLLMLPLLKVRHAYPFAEVRSRIGKAVGLLLDERTERPQPAVSAQPAVSSPELSQLALQAAEGEWIPYMRAIGRIAAGAVIPYPPGVPLVAPGEKWTTAKLEELMDFLAEGAVIQGEHRLQEKLLYVIREESMHDN